ncbi:glycosyltransferase WbuB [Zafaria cholistanensis]|uniref:D-inositol 3-phosphate glycosyltransferase n=1 Tax=Zafaria cholistanensis TaxID=1682741 RepID=A0A5A7NLC0_9MICC|nr:glycosyltransferase family 4 protein [Zafaria cholistanensis]GER21695.1 glycosyltransferase WbuB [Zafaria cholistanensis]
MTTRDFAALIVSLNYAPEPTGNAPYSTKLAEGLNRRGRAVQVLAGYPHYPEWTIPAGYRGMTMDQQINGISVRRLRHAVPAEPGIFSRIHMELSYGLRSVLTNWRKTDVVLTVSPALFASGLAVLKARITGTPIGVWVQDIYSRGLEETKGSSSLAAKVMKRVEGQTLRSATGVAVIHERFRAYVVNELGVPGDRVRVIRNWTHISVPDNVDRAAARSQFGWALQDTIALHAGNMGVKQNLENVIDAARLAELQGSSVRFVLLGHGNQRPALEKYAAGVKNITFMDPLPDELFTQALQAADVLIVNEMPGVKEMSVPSKLTSYFATGRPVVAATEPDSATADEIRASGAGIQVNSGRPQSLLNAVEELVANPELAASCGAAGVPYVRSVLDEGRAVDAYQAWLSNLITSAN